jgi:hypothetical protein
MSIRDTSESGYMQNFIILMSIVILISLTLYTLVIHPSYYSGVASYSSLKVLTDNLAVAGPVMGYADMSGTTENSQVLPFPQARPGLSTVQLNIRLASLRLNWEPGTGDDFSHATVVMVTPGGSETLPRRTTPPLTRPGWSIISKEGVLPGTNVNANDLLESNEQFSIIVAPSANLPPGTPFSIIMKIPGIQPLNIDRTVPIPLQSVMDLG